MSKREKSRWQYKLELESRQNIRWIIIMGGICIAIALWKVLY